jgi:uncharacterized protein (DUF58 family)
VNRLMRPARAIVGAVTPLGRAVVVITVVVWVVGAVFDWRELLLMAAMCLVLLVMAAAAMFGRLDLGSDLTVEPARVIVGERAAGSMILRNLARRRSRPVRVELPVGRSVAVFQTPRLRSGETVDELFVVPTARRGVIPVGPVTTVLGDPLGLVRRAHTWSDRYEIFVHPRTVVLETMAAGLVRDLEGQATNHLTNSDIAFHTLRDYVPGDDRRHVHWKTSAKLGKLMVRQYVDTRRSHLCVLLSTDPVDYGGDDEFELAVSTAASVCLQAFRDGQTLTVIVGGGLVAARTPRALLDRFSAVELGADRGSHVESPYSRGLDGCFGAARRHAPDASVTVGAIGTTPTVAMVKRAAARLSVDTQVLAVQCDPGASSSFRRVGGTGFVVLGNLEQLRNGLTSVMA